jgi:hypothetical protein
MNIGGYEVLSGSQAKPYKESDQIIFYARRQKQAVNDDDFSEGELIPDGSIRRLTMPGMDNPVVCAEGSASAISEM